MKNCLKCGAELTHVEGRKQKSFCNVNCRNKYFYARNKELISNAKAMVNNLNEQSAGITKDLTKPTATTNYSIDTTPKNLEQLKTLCPFGAGTDERRVWISTERQKYGI